MKKSDVNMLEVGDKVAAISMGRKRGILTVSRIESCGLFPVRFEKSALRAQKIILSSNKIKMENPQQATEYYYIS